MRIRPSLIQFCFWLMLLVPVVTASGQGGQNNYGISPVTALRDCSLDQWTGDNGLLSNNLTSVTQASTGFLWITTNNGLMRFDGHRLEIFDQEKIPFLSTEAFYRVYEDQRNVLWFATRGSGIITYSNDQFRQFLPNNKLLPKSIRSLLILEDGSVYAGSDTKGLLFVRDSVVTKIEHPLLEKSGILSLDQAPDGSVMIGTNGNGLLRENNGIVERVMVNNSVDLSVTALKCLKDGRVYVGTTEGLFLLAGGVSTRIEFLKNIQVNQIVTDEFGSVWIASERGLARINENFGLQEFLRAGKNFPGGHITSVFPDREGSLWMSTGKGGLLRLKESPIRNYNESHGLAVDRVNTITEGPDGKFYLCLDDGFINVIDKGVIAPFEIQNKSWNESIRDIFVEEDGTYWIGSYNGLIRKDKRGEKLFTTEDGLSSNSVRRIFGDSRKNLWIGTRSGGVIQFVNGKPAKVFNKKSGLSSDYILAIEEDRKGRILIGTHSGGLNIINPDGSVEINHIRPDDDGVLIFNVHIDSANEIFLVTSVGLYHFNQKNKQFTRIVLSDVMKGESYFDWVEDLQGNVWISTNIGILQLRKAHVQSYLAGKISSVRRKTFNDYDGMKNKECTGATRSTLSSKGEVWIPTIEGVCVVNPYGLNENKIIPPVYITEVITDKGVIQNPGKELIVMPGNFRISVNFTSTSLRAPNKVRFKYKLENVDADWKTPEPLTRSVDYTNLSPGKYRFMVIAANNDGIWNEQGATLGITVKPFYYQTAGFYVVILALLLVTFFALYKWRVSAIEQKNEELLKVNSELDRFVYSASHDLRAPLTSILGLVRLTRIDTDPVNRLQYLDMVEKSINKLDGFIHDIINYSRNARTEVKSHEVEFQPLIQGIIEALSYQDKSQTIRKEVSVQGSGPFFTDGKRLEIVLFNLISNAIKYHFTMQVDPFIMVKVNYNPSTCTIDVIDNGSGIDKEHLENIFKMFYRADDKSTGSGLGLFISKETVEKLRGVLTVKSAVGKGSTFRIQIPCLSGNHKG